METLSFKELLDVKKTNEHCSIHNTLLVAFKGQQPFCTECKKEEIKESEKVRVTTAENRHKKRRTYDVLKLDSILYDETIQEATFDNYLCDKDTNEWIMRKQAGELALKIIQGETFNMLLKGSPGVGKSHLAMSMLKVINESENKDKSCLFVSLEEVLSMIRESYKNPLSKFTEFNMVELMGNVDVLVIDDLGSETGRIDTQKFASDFTNKILKRVLERRQQKVTITTTNLDSSELSQIYDKKVVSRLYKKINSQILVFDGIGDKRTKF